MLGSLYIIHNLLNNKVYIGKTYNSIEYRFKEHIKDAFTIDYKTLEYKYDYKLYRAIRKYGQEYFKIELIGKFEEGILEQKEQEYIAKYDSYHNGYNSTLSGDGHRTINLTEEQLKNIATMYNNGNSILDIATTYDINVRLVSNILREQHITIRKSCKKVIAYDSNFNIEKIFLSKKSAYNYINNNEHECNFRNFWKRLELSCQKGNIAYGHRWQLASDLVYEDKIFRTKFDKEAYIQGKPAYQPEGKQYWVVDGALNKIIDNQKIYGISYDKRCTICGKKLKGQALMCIDCYKKQQRSNIPDIQTLQDLISNYSYEAIGRMYGVTGKAVRKWADSYGLVESRKIDSSGVTCIELNIHFNTFKEAAEYLINNGLTSATNVGTLGYRISQAKKNNTKYQNFHWQ